MPLIKRYPNRKLYDTEARQYITLDEIAELVRRGEDVQVLEHASGADLTALTLSQIVFELQKKQPSFLPHNLLAALIHGGTQRLSSVLSALGLDAPMLGELVDAEIQHRVEELVARGELDVEQGSLWLEKLAQTSLDETEPELHQRAAQLITPERIEEILRHLPIPTQKDLHTLQEQLEQLEAALDQISAQRAS